MPGDLDSTSNNNNNTYILDAESGAEMARLMKQDRLLTSRCGGRNHDNDSSMQLLIGQPQALQG